MLNPYFLIVVLVFFFFSCQDKAPEDIVAEEAALELVAEGYKFTEGPAADGDGNVYFTDQPNDRIVKWGIDGEVSTWMQPSGRSNGLCFDADGILWACADESNQLWKIDMDKNVTVLIDNYAGKKLNGPNDIWINRGGDAWFSDPFYKRPWWDHDSIPQECQCVYYLAAGQHTPVRVVNDLVQPNGIIGTPDGKMLYVTDIGDKKTYSYTIKPDGSLTDKMLFCEMGSDGMTLDDQGNLYLTGKGVTVFNTSGEKIRQIDVPENWTANVCFGGPDMDHLFITAMKGLYRIKMNVKGVGSQ